MPIRAGSPSEPERAMHGRHAGRDLTARMALAAPIGSYQRPPSTVERAGRAGLDIGPVHRHIPARCDAKGIPASIKAAARTKRRAADDEGHRSSRQRSVNVSDLLDQSPLRQTRYARHIGADVEIGSRRGRPVARLWKAASSGQGLGLRWQKRRSRWPGLGRMTTVAWTQGGAVPLVCPDQRPEPDSRGVLPRPFWQAAASAQPGLCRRWFPGFFVIVRQYALTFGALQRKFFGVHPIFEVKPRDPAPIRDKLMALARRLPTLTVSGGAMGICVCRKPLSCGGPACKASRGRGKAVPDPIRRFSRINALEENVPLIDRRDRVFRLTNAGNRFSTTLNASLRCSSTSNASWAPRITPALATRRRYRDGIALPWMIPLGVAQS